MDCWVKSCHNEIQIYSTVPRPIEKFFRENNYTSMSNEKKRNVDETQSADKEEKI